MAYDCLDLEPRDGVLIIRLNRPQVLNALNRATLSELGSAIDQAAAESSVRAVLITGAGDKAFAAGADISEFTSLSPDTSLAMSRSGQEIFRRIERLGKPVLAAINGFALGGGLELALACHLRLASDTAKMGLPELKLGLIPGYGGTQRLTRLVGPAKATELILGGDPVDAATALQIGLVNGVAPLAELLDRSLAMLALMTRQSRESLAAALTAIRIGVEGEDGFLAESRLFSDVMASANGQEGVAAFLAKRKPNFS